MSQQARQGNAPHSVTKFRETTADGREFDKRKDVVAAKEEPAGRVQALREAQVCDSENETPRASNQPHHPQDSNTHPHRQPVPKQSGVNLSSEED